MKTIDNQSMVIAFIAKNPESNVDTIATGTAIFKLNVYKVLKTLVETKQLSIVDQSNPPRYILVNRTVKAKQDPILSKKTSEEKKGETQDVFPKNKTTGRDTSKLKFMGKEYAKGQLVLAVVKHHCETHKTTLAKLKEIFADESLQPRYGMIQLLNTAKKLSEGRDRFFLKPEQLIKIGEAKVAVCNQWGSNNIGGFLKVAKKLGYTIK